MIDYSGLADADAKAAADRTAMPPPPLFPAKVLPVVGKKSTMQGRSVSSSAEPVLGPQWWASKVRSYVRTCVSFTSFCSEAAAVFTPWAWPLPTFSKAPANVVNGCP